MSMVSRFKIMMARLVFSGTLSGTEWGHYILSHRAF
jgi:hypothetical protein